MLFAIYKVASHICSHLILARQSTLLRFGGDKKFPLRHPDWECGEGGGMVAEVVAVVVISSRPGDLPFLILPKS